MGLIIVVFILSQFVANGLWYCATQQSSLFESHVVVIPILSSIALLIFGLIWICENWDS